MIGKINIFTLIMLVHRYYISKDIWPTLIHLNLHMVNMQKYRKILNLCFQFWHKESNILRYLKNFPRGVDSLVPWKKQYLLPHVPRFLAVVSAVQSVVLSHLINVVSKPLGIVPASEKINLVWFNSRINYFVYDVRCLGINLIAGLWILVLNLDKFPILISNYCSLI